MCFEWNYNEFICTYIYFSQWKRDRNLSIRKTEDWSLNRRANLYSLWWNYIGIYPIWLISFWVARIIGLFVQTNTYNILTTNVHLKQIVRAIEVMLDFKWTAKTLCDSCQFGLKHISKYTHYIVLWYTFWFNFGRFR